jgi:hypothetical protein
VQPLEHFPARTLTLPISFVALPTFSPRHTHGILHCTQSLSASLALYLFCTHRLRKADTRGLLVLKSNKLGGDLVRGRVLVAPNCDRITGFLVVDAVGPFA